MSATLMPLYEAQAYYDSGLAAKLEGFFVWLDGIEKILDAKGTDCNVFVIYEKPFTSGGPFTQIPKAILAANVKYRQEATESRRAITLALQSMMAWGGPGSDADGYPNQSAIESGAHAVERTLRWYSKPESALLPS